MPKKLLLKKVGKTLSEKSKKVLKEKSAIRAKNRAERVPLSDKEIDEMLKGAGLKGLKPLPPKPVKPSPPAGKKLKMMEMAGTKVLKNKPKKNKVQKYKSGGKVRGVGCALRGYGKAMKG
jgi:hypothetical protein